MPSRRPRPPVLPPRLAVVVGKGGVGRSSVSAAMGMVAARRERRTLIVEVTDRPVMPSWFGVPDLGYAPTRLDPGLPLWSHRVSWPEALREYGLIKLRVQALYRLVFQNPFVQRLLPAIPGIAEIVMVGKIEWSATRGLKEIGPVDTVVLDAPATGHGVSLLTSPEVIAESVPAGPLAEDARRLRNFLKDPRQTQFHLVTLPEEMPVQEAEDLWRLLGQESGMPFASLLVNQHRDGDLPPDGESALGPLIRSPNLAPEVCASVAAALRTAVQARQEREYLKRLETRVPLPRWYLPEVSGARTHRDRVEVLAEHLDAFLWREER